MTPVHAEPSQLVIFSSIEEGGSACCSGSDLLDDRNSLKYSVMKFSLVLRGFKFFHS